MPSAGLPKATIRVEPGLWAAFTAACPPKDDGGAATVLREFIRWYVRQPGARLPKRPVTTDTT
jgi:hypothetical protein